MESYIYLGVDLGYVSVNSLLEAMGAAALYLKPF